MPRVDEKIKWPEPSFWSDVTSLTNHTPQGSH